jgi:trk system potassium uptake protein TrkH
MNIRLLAYFLSLLCGVLAFFMLSAVAWSLVYHENNAAVEILGAAALALGIALGLFLLGRKAPRQFFQREALAAVAFSWLVAGVVGALPFITTGQLNLIDAVFESVSGFTTTGASVIDQVEVVLRGVLWWRSLTHWLGGLGIVIMFLAVLPHLGAGGKRLLRSESARLDPGTLTPRVHETAVILGSIYLVLTAAGTVGYLVTGKMSLFESLCHTFGALATGGFSTRQASIAAYNSFAVETVTVILMVMGATNFSLYYYAFQRKWKDIYEDTEFRTYLAAIVIPSLLIAISILGHPIPSADSSGNTNVASYSFLGALRASVFSVVSLLTNTGYVTDDFDAWTPFARLLLFLLLFPGGCAGSTCGGWKMMRVVILVKMIWRRLEVTFRPNSARAIRMRDEVISLEAQTEATTFVITYLGVFLAACLVITGLGYDAVAAMSGVAACMSNTGPGQGVLGPTETFSQVPALGKITFVLCMLVGRVELFSFLVLLTPGFWRRD